MITVFCILCSFRNRFANGALEFMANFDFCGRMREKRIVKFCSHQEKKQIKHRDDSR